MLLLDMLTDYVFRTTPTVSFCGILIIFELIFQLFTPAFLMTEVIRRRSLADRIMLTAVPMVFFTTFVIMNIILGGCFLNGGYIYEEELITFILSSGVVKEIWMVLLLFPITYIIVEFILHYSAQKQKQLKRLLNLPGALLNFLMFFLCLIPSIYIGTNGSFPDTEIFPAEFIVLWYTYAVYNLLFQILVNITAIIFHVLFSRREINGSVRLLSTSPEWCDRQVKNFFTDGCKVVFCTCLEFAATFYVLMFWAMLDEGFSVSLVLTFHIFLIPLDFGVLCSLWYLLRPSAIPALKYLESQGNTVLIKRLFCLEFLDTAYPPLKGFTVWVTPHFILTPVAFFKKLYYIPLFQNMEQTTRGRALRFRDGSVLKSQKFQPGDWNLICRALKNARQ